MGAVEISTLTSSVCPEEASPFSLLSGSKASVQGWAGGWGSQPVRQHRSGQCCKELSFSSPVSQKRKNKVCETKEQTLFPNAAFPVGAFELVPQFPKVSVGTLRVLTNVWWG